MGQIKNFRKLNIWKNSIEIVKKTYKLTARFPKTETYGLASQMQRAAISIPSNIAEGFRRRHSKEFRQFLNIAVDSLADLETQLFIAKELGYLDDKNYNVTFQSLDLTNRMIITLYHTCLN